MMEILHADEGASYTGGKTVVALGNFDGLHMAHMKIIRDAIAKADEGGYKCGVVLFEEHTSTVLPDRKRVPLITPNEAKIELLQREKLDFVYIRKFTPEFMKNSPEEFVRLLCGNLNIAAVCVGYDYRFGYKAAGDVHTLKALGEKYGFAVHITPAVMIDGEIVSSTAIRRMIAEGDMQKAEVFLTRRFCIEGIVERGLQNGTKMGFPTANIAYSPDMAIPPDGVYAGVAYVHGRRLKSVINVGANPTFAAKRTTVEAHILGFSEDIYGEYIRVSFARRMRGEIKFESVEELKAQIAADAETVAGMTL